jgi:N-acetylglucosaminyl-diphospho-decaprenol L-rhamnosyltransferase
MAADPGGARPSPGDGVSVTSLDVVCVNWNSGGHLAECLASLARAGREGFSLNRVVVVDNASSDGSAASLDYPSLPLKVIANPTNRGFATACNQGARGSASEYVLFLNPDTLLEAESLAQPLAFLEGEDGQGVGICGIRLTDRQGVVARSCARFPTPGQFLAASAGLDRLFPTLFRGHVMRDWNHLDSRPVDHVIGAFYLVRRALFESLGGFDERYFVYLEDLDFSLRARQAGWRTFYLTESQAYHKGGGSSEQVKAERLLYLLRSRLRYAARHFSWGGATAVALGTLVLEPVVRVGAALAGGGLGQARDTIKAYWMLGTASRGRNDLGS